MLLLRPGTLKISTVSGGAISLCVTRDTSASKTRRTVVVRRTEPLPTRSHMASPQAPIMGRPERLTEDANTTSELASRIVTATAAPPAPDQRRAHTPIPWTSGSSPSSPDLELLPELIVARSAGS